MGKIKLQQIILIFGIMLGVFVSMMVCYMALDHNPQNVYSDNPEDLLLLMYLWCSAVAFPFAVVSLFFTKKEKNQK